MKTLLDYFTKLPPKRPELYWHNYPVGHFPKHSYLVGTKKLNKQQVQVDAHPELEDMAQGWACPSAKAVSVVEKGGKTISEAAESHAEKDSFQYPSFNTLISFSTPKSKRRDTIISTAREALAKEPEHNHRAAKLLINHIEVVR